MQKALATLKAAIKVRISGGGGCRMWAHHACAAQEYEVDHPPKRANGAFCGTFLFSAAGAEISDCAVVVLLLWLLVLLLAAALAAAAWGVVDAALPPVGLSPRAQQAAATALLLVAGANAAAAARGGSV
jgi:hypothetical protein